MRTRLVIAMGVISLVLALLVVGYAVKAGNGYQLNNSVIAGGGGASQGVPYLLQGTAGQSEAGMLAGGHYTLEGGFWEALQPGVHKTFLPLLTRSN